MAVIFVSSTTVVTTRQFARAVSSTTQARVTEGEFLGFWDRSWWLFVKGWHALEFAVLFVLLARSLRGRVWLAATLSILFAISDEWHQTFVPARGGRWTDVVVDVAGVVAALCLWRSPLGKRWLHPRGRVEVDPTMVLD
jgi:VanZ family protein